VLVEFADDIVVTYVMGGLAREFRTPVETMRHVLDAAAASGMPTDPRLWLEPPRCRRTQHARRSRPPPTKVWTVLPASCGGRPEAARGHLIDV
jgi:hypothetical protein